MFLRVDRLQTEIPIRPHLTKMQRQRRGKVTNDVPRRGHKVHVPRHAVAVHDASGTLGCKYGEMSTLGTLSRWFLFKCRWRDAQRLLRLRTISSGSRHDALKDIYSKKGAVALPVAAAAGGMLVPALIYLAIAPEHPSGWGVVMATDIVVCRWLHGASRQAHSR